MNEITVTRRSKAGGWRCPWCHDGDSLGALWVLCPRDETPIHKECVRDFGVCPICREEVNEVGLSATGIARGLDISVRPRVRGEFSFEPFEVPELGANLEDLLDGIRSFYRPVWYWPVLGTSSAVFLVLLFGAYQMGLCALSMAFIAGLSLLATWSEKWQTPTIKAWSGDDFHNLSPESIQDLVIGDQQALDRAESFETMTNLLVANNAKLAELWSDFNLAKQCHDSAGVKGRRESLRIQAPIEDARRIRGIGDGIIHSLKLAGIQNLRDLLEIDPSDVHGIGPWRADLLREWAEHRGEAIERLLYAEDGSIPEYRDLEMEEGVHKIRVEAETLRDQSLKERDLLELWRETRARLRGQEESGDS